MYVIDNEYKKSKFIIFILIVFIIGCNDINEKFILRDESSKFVENETNKIKNGNFLAIAPIKVETYSKANLYDDITYHPYYLFDRNSITCWIGEIKENSINLYNNKSEKIYIESLSVGKKRDIASLYFNKFDRNYDLAYIRILSGIQSNKSIRDNFSRPKNIIFSFYQKDESNAELIKKITIRLKDDSNWQNFEIPTLSMNNIDIIIISVDIEDYYEGNKYPEKMAISEIEFLVEDKTGTLNNDKYNYLYDELKNWFYNQGTKDLNMDLAPHYLYPNYKFISEDINFDDWYSTRRRDLQGQVVVTFNRARELINFGEVPKEQADYLNSLPRTYDYAVAIISRNSTIRRFWNEFIIYEDINIENTFNRESLTELDVYLPFMEILGLTLTNPKFTNRRDTSEVFQGTIKTFFENNPNLNQLYVTKNHNNQQNGTIEYMMYYSVEYIESRRFRFVRDSDPLMIGIFDKKGRLAKLFYKEDGEEHHYYFIWDENNKVEKILALEIGNYSIKKIKKIIAIK